MPSIPISYFLSRVFRRSFGLLIVSYNFYAFGVDECQAVAREESLRAEVARLQEERRVYLLSLEVSRVTCPRGV
jgi:hypothetical protein